MRNNRLRTKSLWRVVEPPKNRARPTQRLTSPSSRPRVWAGVRRNHPLDARSTADLQRGRAKTSCWPRSLLLRKTRTVLHGKVSNTLRSYSLGREVTAGWAGGTKTFGRAARSSSRCESSPHGSPFTSPPSAACPTLVEAFFSPGIFPIALAKPRFLSPVLQTSPPSQMLRILPPMEGTQLRIRSRHQTSPPTHYSTIMEHRLWSRIPKPAPQ